MFFATKQPTVIAPSQVSASIVKLVENARERLVLVSPYFQPWDHLRRALEGAIERGVDTRLIIRTDHIPAAKQFIEPLQLSACHIERLHAKLYFSEKRAITTSMNLFAASRDSWETGISISATAKLYPTLTSYAEKHFVTKSKSIEDAKPATKTTGTGYLEKTYFQTLTLLQRGLSAEQIANERSLKVSTVYSHFEVIAAARRYPIEKLVDPVRVHAIQNALKACGADSALKNIKTYLLPDTAAEYWEIAAVRNFIEDEPK